MNINHELERIWKETIMVYFKLPSRHARWPGFDSRQGQGWDYLYLCHSVQNVSGSHTVSSPIGIWIFFRTPLHCNFL